MTRWEHCGRFEYAATREAAAVLFGDADPNEVRFAGWSEPAKPRRWLQLIPIVCQPPRFHTNVNFGA